MQYPTLRGKKTRLVCRVRVVSGFFFAGPTSVAASLAIAPGTGHIAGLHLGYAMHGCGCEYNPVSCGLALRITRATSGALWVLGFPISAGAGGTLQAGRGGGRGLFWYFAGGGRGQDRGTHSTHSRGGGGSSKAHPLKSLRSDLMMGPAH
jgi:hypothetical protein